MDMDVECLRYQNQPFQAHLQCGTKLVRCQIRDRWFSATPEELVRQAVLVCLKNACRDISVETLVLRVEHTDLDIAIYSVSQHPDFRPALSPILIIETKRRDIHPVDTEINERQLKDYLHINRCRVGALTNCRTLWGYQQDGEHVHKKALHDFAELVAWIEREHEQAQQVLEQHQDWFNRAQAGCFDSFRQLVSIYGQGFSTTIAFAYERNQMPVLINGIAFKVTGEAVRFRVRGVGALQECTASNFRQLRSIQSLEYQT
jgi:hypothetical protein